jgi:hypothetical protein
MEPVVVESWAVQDPNPANWHGYLANQAEGGNLVREYSRHHLVGL